MNGRERCGDVVEKAGDVSTVRVARSEQQAIAARLAELEDPAWKLPLRGGISHPTFFVGEDSFR